MGQRGVEVQQPQGPPWANEPAAGPRSEQATIDRFLQLRPAVLEVMRAATSASLRETLGSITSHQLQLVARLPEDGLTMQQVAAVLGISGPAACTLVDRLVSRGLGERRADGHDRRVVRVVATEQGRRLARRYDAAQHDGAAALLARLTRRQAGALIEVMEAIAGGPPIRDEASMAASGAGSAPGAGSALGRGGGTPRELLASATAGRANPR